MSIEALNWAFNVQVQNAGAKLVLLTLANYSNEIFEAYPSQKALAKKTCLSERAIRDNLVRLEEMKLISRVPRTRSNGSYTTDLFKLNVGCDAVVESAETEPETQRQNLPAAESADGKNCQTQRQILPNPAADSAAPEPSLTTTITKSNTPASAQAREALIERGVPTEIADRWLLIRAAKKSEKNYVELNHSAIEIVQSEARLAGITLAQAVECCSENMWIWFRASWYAKLPVNKTLGCAHDPPKSSAREDWRSSPVSTLNRGRELGIEPLVGETDLAYRNRVGKADWLETRKKAGEALSKFKAKVNAGVPA